MYWHYAVRLQRVGMFANPEGEEVWPLSAEAVALKRTILKLYRSQHVARNVAGYELLLRIRGESESLFQAERLRHVVKPNYSMPIHPEPAFGRVLRSKPWRKWEKAISQWVASAGDPNWS